MISIDGIVKILLVLVLVTAALIITRRHILSLFTTYAAQSLLIAAIALLLAMGKAESTLIFIAIITVVSKTILIPLIMRKIHRSMRITNDVKFKYLTPIGSMVVSIILILIIHHSFARYANALSLQGVYFLGAVLGISLTFMGMLVIFSRRKAITKIVGYLSMENGVLLFSLFFPELPFIVEILIILDLVMLIMLVTLLAFGIDSTMERFHDKLNEFRDWIGDDAQ